MIQVKEINHGIACRIGNIIYINKIKVIVKIEK